MDVRGTPGTVPDSLRRFTRACSAFVSSATPPPGAPGMTRHRARIDVHEGVPADGVAIYAAAGTARGRRVGRLTMTEPTGGPPRPQPHRGAPESAAAAAPAPAGTGAPAGRRELDGAAAGDSAGRVPDERRARRGRP